MIDLNGKTILIAEDEEFNYKFLERVLIKLGAEVIRAHNGKEAVELVGSNSNLWILLLDLKMPLMTGYEAVHHIRSAGYCLPVLAVTAYAFSEDREKAIAAGCDDYISKPFEIQDLIELLKKYL